MPPCETGEMETPRIKSSRPFSEDCPAAEGSEPTGKHMVPFSKETSEAGRASGSRIT